MKRRLRAPSPAVVISLIALFVALGGTAYASGLISGRQIIDHSIPARKLTAGAVSALRGQRGPAGPEAGISLFKNQYPADSVLHLLATVRGVAVSYACQSNPDQVRLFLHPPHRPGHSLGVTGNYAQDGVLKVVPRFGSLDVAGQTLNVDVMAQGTNGIYSRIDLAATFHPEEESAPPSADYCQVWGLITPGVIPGP